MLGGPCWAGGGEGFSEGTFEAGNEGEGDFGLVEGKVDNIVDCSLAGYRSSSEGLLLQVFST